VPVQGCTLPYSRAIPLLPLWAVRPVQSLSACTRVHFTFYGCLTAYTIWFPQSSSKALPLKMGQIFCSENSVRIYHSTTRKVPKIAQTSSIYHFWRDLFHLPKQHVANDTMGTAALGAKEPGHGQQFRPCTHMSPLRHAVWRNQTKLTLRAGHRRCAIVLSIVLS